MLPALMYMWLVYGKPDPTMSCNGMLAGLVAITAPCAFVTPMASVVIGLVAGVLVIWSCFFVERVLKIDDPVGAVSVHGLNGLWGIVALGLFADGTYGQGWNGSFWYKLADGTLQWYPEKLKDIPAGAIEQGVTGLLYGNPSQLFAELIGIAANILWVFPVALAFFWVVEKLIGNRVSAAVELQGLDIPEMGVPGYIEDDPKSPELPVLHGSVEPRAAMIPPDGTSHYSLVVDGLEPANLATVWSRLCQPSDSRPSPEFLAVYRNMTTLQGNRFRLRSGEPKQIRQSLEKLLQDSTHGTPVRVHVEN
jgi:hypothetical protein